METSITPWEEAMQTHIALEAKARQLFSELTYWDWFFLSRKYKTYINLLCDIIEVKQRIDEYADVLFPANCRHTLENILECQIP